MKAKTLIKRILLSLGVFMLLVASFTIYANVRVEQAAKEHIYYDVDSVNTH